MTNSMTPSTANPSLMNLVVRYVPSEWFRESCVEDLVEQACPILPVPLIGGPQHPANSHFEHDEEGCRRHDLVVLSALAVPIAPLGYSLGLRMTDQPNKSASLGTTPSTEEAGDDSPPV